MCYFASIYCLFFFVQISGYIFCGKLRSAYLIAVKGDRIEDVKRISAMAQQTGQTATRNICDKWLQQKGALWNTWRTNSSPDSKDPRINIS